MCIYIYGSFIRQPTYLLLLLLQGTSNWVYVEEYYIQLKLNSNVLSFKLPKFYIVNRGEKKRESRRMKERERARDVKIEIERFEIVPVRNIHRITQQQRQQQ